jgi:predicted nucleic acid-binding protein
VVVDTGPLVAAADRDDVDHARCAAALLSPEFSLVIPALVVTETCYFIGRRVSPQAEATFLRGLTALDVEAPRYDEWLRIADLVDRYADFPLGCVDASIVALAERLNADTLITLDHRHFGAVRPRHCATFHLLPD